VEGVVLRISFNGGILSRGDFVRSPSCWVAGTGQAGQYTMMTMAARWPAIVVSSPHHVVVIVDLLAAAAAAADDALLLQPHVPNNEYQRARGRSITTTDIASAFCRFPRQCLDDTDVNACFFKCVLDDRNEIKWKLERVAFISF